MVPKPGTLACWLVNLIPALVAISNVDFDFRISSTSSGFAKMLSVDPLSRMMSSFILLDMFFCLSIKHTCIPLHPVFFRTLALIAMHHHRLLLGLHVLLCLAYGPIFLWDLVLFWTFWTHVSFLTTAVTCLSVVVL